MRRSSYHFFPAFIATHLPFRTPLTRPAVALPLAAVVKRASPNHFFKQPIPNVPFVVAVAPLESASAKRIASRIQLQYKPPCLVASPM